MDLNYNCAFVLEVALVNGDTAPEQPGTLSLCMLGTGASPHLQHLPRECLHPSSFSWLVMKRNEPLQSTLHRGLF